MYINKRRGPEGKFPGKLHDMMKYCERENLESVISWVLNGHGFVIHDTRQLADILPMFFGLTKYRSFRRQLNMWHFQRITDGPNKGTFVHPYFVKGQRSLCSLMSRQILPTIEMANIFGRKGEMPTSKDDVNRNIEMKDNTTTLMETETWGSTSADIRRRNDIGNYETVVANNITVSSTPPLFSLIHNSNSVASNPTLNLPTQESLLRQPELPMIQSPPEQNFFNNAGSSSFEKCTIVDDRTFQLTKFENTTNDFLTHQENLSSTEIIFEDSQRSEKESTLEDKNDTSCCDTTAKINDLSPAMNLNFVSPKIPNNGDLVLFEGRSFFFVEEEGC